MIAESGLRISSQAGTGNAHVDLRTLIGGGFNRQGATHISGPLTHLDQPDTLGVFPIAGSGGFEADAIVGDSQLTEIAGLFQPEGNLPGAGMLLHIGQRALKNAVERQFDCIRQPLRQR